MTAIKGNIISTPAPTFPVSDRIINPVLTGNQSIISSETSIEGWAGVNKRIIKIVNLPQHPATPQLVNIGYAQEVAIFSDFPIYYSLEDPGQMIGPISHMKFRGNLKQIYLSRGALYQHGVVAIQYSRPSYGASFERENPYNKTEQYFPMASFDVVAGDSSAISAALTVPGASGQPVEAYYVSSVQFLRTGGTVSVIAYYETESGANNDIVRRRLSNPTDRGEIIFPEKQRISSTGVWLVSGSIEAANTPVSIVFTAAVI